MSDKLEVGQIIQGKVTGIQPYGAFVSLNENAQGLVHISEITHGFVKDINDFLSVGDEVKVKILEINEEQNKYSLSIRATEEPPKQQQTAKPKQTKQTQTNQTSTGFNTLKNKLEEWMEQTSFKK